MQVITEDVARKVLSVVDKGLSHGVGNPIPGQMCVEAAVCYALGLPHGDDPGCVSPMLRKLKIRLNDSEWSSKEARAKGLRRLAVAQLGSKGALDEKAFREMLVDYALRVTTPQALRSAASVIKQPEHKKALLDAASRCEVEASREAAQSARQIARDAAAAAYADAYADAAAAAAAYADAYAAAAAYADAYADAAAAAAAYADAYAYAAAAAAADADAYAAADAAAAAAADAAAAAAAYAAAAADAARKKIRDKHLSDYAESVVQMLIKLDAPGCQWLPLTELAGAAA